MEVSRILDGLYHGTYPLEPDYEVLHDLGIRLIINMQGSQAPCLHPHVAIPNLWLRTNDNPITRIPIYELARGVVAARQVMDRKQRVFVHCRQGRHRSSAMVASILISRGLSTDEAVTLIKQQRPRANPTQWYIRERMVRFERLWKRPRVERSRLLVKAGQEALTADQVALAARSVRLAIAAHPRNAAAWALQADILSRGEREDDAERFRHGAAWLEKLVLA